MSGLGKGHDAAAHSKAPQRQPALPPPGRNSGHRPCDNSDDSSDSDFVRLSKPRRQPAKPAAQPAAAGKRATAAGKHAPPAPQARAQQAPAAANQRHQQQLPRGAAAAAKPQQALLRQQAGGSQQPQRQHPPPAATLQQREQHPPAGNPLQPPARRPAHGAVSGGSRQAVQGAVGGGGRPPKPSAAPAQKRKGQAASGAGAGVSKKAKAAQPPPRWAEGAADADNSSSGDDDFVPGSLRPVLLPTVPLEVAPRAAPPRKRQADGGGRGGGRSGQGGGMAAVDPGFGERVAVIRLDSLELARWPGWQASTAGIRRVAPWQPSSSALATGARCGGGAASGARVISTPSLLSYDLSQLGGSFQGVLLQLHALGGGGRSGRTSRDGVAQPGAPAGGSGRTSGSPSWEQLEALQLGDDVVANGLLFVWASKAAVAPAVRWMARRGFKLVENLMWVLLGANGAPLQLHAPLFSRSHATLLVGRRGDQKKQHLELRHQRTPDVIAAPALRPGEVPDTVYEMIETLLPEARIAATSGTAPRLLELAFAAPPAGRPARPGWVKVAQQGGTPVPGDGAAAPGMPRRIIQLSDDALVKLLGHLEQRERLTHACLVCRRFRQLCLAPELLRTVRISKRFGGAAAAARSLLAWLARHGAHVRQLDLELSVFCCGADAGSAEEEELGSLVAACVRAVAGHLQQLRLGFGTPLVHLAWLPQLRSLQSLDASNNFYRELCFAFDASGMAALQEMRLAGHPLVLQATARLPIALTSLTVDGSGKSSSMPQQVAQLPNLRRLSLKNAAYSSSGMAPLSGLTALTSLELVHLRHLPPPAALAALTGLRHLCLEFYCSRQQAAATLDGALLALRQLTCLALTGVDAVPAAVGSLPHLQRLFFWRQHDEADRERDERWDDFRAEEGLELEEESLEALHLPHPHTLRCLRVLGTNFRIAAASVPALVAMPALEELWLPGAPHDRGVSAERWNDFWGWAARHPPLRRFYVFDLDSYQRAARELISLWAARPSLHVRLSDAWPMSFEAAFRAK